MSASAFESLLYNAALLLVLVLVYDLLARRLRRTSLAFRLLTGAVLGGISIAAMLAALHLEGGVIFDTRSVVLSTGTLFYGTVPGLIGGLIAAAYRVALGGPGAVTGVLVITESVVIGLLWRRWRKVAERDPSVLELYLFGLLVHAVMLGLMWTLPDPLATLRQISLPVIVIYPLATVLLGLLIIDARRRLRTESALRESEERFAALFEEAPLGYQSLDEDGRFIVVNRRWLETLGYTRDEVIGRWFGEFLAPEYVEAFRERFPLFKERGEIVSEFQMLRKDGERRTIAFDGRIGHYPDGSMRATHCILADVTERRRAEAEVLRLNEQLERRVAERTAELEAANSELEAFAYSVSHDLRAPLRAIDGFSAMVREDAARVLREEDLEHLDRVRRAAQRMGELIDHLLALSRASRVEVSPEDVDLGAAAESVVAELRAAQPDRQVEIVVSPGLRAWADPVLLRAVLANLLGNAWKFTGRHETARIEIGSTLTDQGETAFFVRDDGAGFDQAQSARLFRTFQRLHQANEFEGDGIGLATVQRLIARHGGRIWAEAAVERGATFYFTLPHSPGTSAPA